MPKVKVLWKAPNVAIAQRGPRYLEYTNREGKVEFFAPQMDAEGHIFYEVDEEYGRRLLAGQHDRFFLLSPDSMIIKRRRKDGMGAEYVTVHSLAKTGTVSSGSLGAPAANAFPGGRTPPSWEPSASALSQGADGPDGTPAPSQVPEVGPEGATGTETAVLPRETGEDNPAAGVAPSQTEKHNGKKEANEHKGNRPRATGA